MLILTIFITVIYTLLIGSFIVGFFRIKIFNDLNNPPKNSFSIIIPFRNEAKNLPQLLDSLSRLIYPNSLFEILLVDDESSDDGKYIVEKFKKEHPNLSIQILNNIRKSNSPKKDAIETAIKKSKFDWIVTTDADCILPENWLISFDNFIQKKNPKMIAAPVTYQVENIFLEQFQLLDFISLIGTTIGSFGIKKPFLCNGANLCYSKKIFFEVNGFERNNSISSGDDIFLLEKVNQKYPDDVHYLKSITAIVITKPESTLKELMNQRIRWASKTSATNNWFGKFVGIFVFLINLLIVALLASSIFKPFLLNHFLLGFGIKFIVDFILILTTLNFANQTKIVIFYPVTAIIHPFFIVIIVFLSIFKKSVLWKSRHIIS